MRVLESESFPAVPSLRADLPPAAAGTHKIQLPYVPNPFIKIALTALTLPAVSAGSLLMLSVLAGKQFQVCYYSDLEHSGGFAINKGRYAMMELWVLADQDSASEQVTSTDAASAHCTSPYTWYRAAMFVSQKCCIKQGEQCREVVPAVVCCSLTEHAHTKNQLIS